MRVIVIALIAVFGLVVVITGETTTWTFPPPGLPPLVAQAGGPAAKPSAPLVIKTPIRSFHI